MRVVWLASLRGWIGWCPGDHQHTHIVPFLDPCTDRFERGHHVGIECVQFVGPVDGHAGHETKVVLIADGVKFKGHHIAFRWVHEITDQVLLLHLIADLQ